MNSRIAVLAVFLGMLASLQADPVVQGVQQALKDEGFYYGEVTGQKDSDTTAAIRRYQIRNGLQITGDINDETLKSLGVNSSGAQSVVKASPTSAPAVSAPTPSESNTSDLRDDRRTAGPTNPLTGQPFPDVQNRSPSASLPRDEQPPTEPEYGAVPAHPVENFAGTPYQTAPPQVQQNLIVSAQNILARQGLYRGAIDGLAGPELEFSLRAYQSRVRLPVTGRLDLETLAALRLLPGGAAPIYVPHHRPRNDEPVRGEWVPER